jgi:hypothetical protein
VGAVVTGHLVRPSRHIELPLGLILATRLVTGRPLFTHPKTDASFLRAGREKLAHGHVTRWSYLPGWKRASIRLTTVLVVLVAAATAAFRPPGLLTAERVALWWCLPLAGVAWWLAARHRHHHTTYTQPVAELYARKFGVPVHEAEQAIDIPTNHLDDPDAEVTIRLPASWQATRQAETELARVVGNRLGMPDAEHHIDPIGAPTLVLRNAPPPPDTVPYEAVMAGMQAGAVDRLYLGQGPRDQPIYMSWQEDGAHAGLSFASGMGKSTLARLVAAQVLHAGGRVEIFDIPKMGKSHSDWCRHPHGDLIPGVALHRKPADAHDALIRLAQERLDRAEQQYANPNPKLQPVLVILEELNITIPMLRTYWDETGGKKTPPSILAIQSLACAGRETLINCLFVAQKLSAAACGGDQVRENLGIKLLGGVSQRTIQNLVPDISPAPKQSNQPGRINMCIPRKATTLQVGRLTDAEARAWALGGVPAPLSPQHTHTQTVGTSVVPGDRHLRLVKGGDLVSLTEAVAEGLLDAASKDTVKKRKRRDASFPEPVAKEGETQLYRRCDLVAYEQRRKDKEA